MTTDNFVKESKEVLKSFALWMNYVRHASVQGGLVWRGTQVIG